MTFTAAIMKNEAKEIAANLLSNIKVQTDNNIEDYYLEFEQNSFINSILLNKIRVLNDIEEYISKGEYVMFLEKVQKAFFGPYQK